MNNENISNNNDIIILDENTIIPTDQRFLDRPQATEQQLQTVNVDPKYSQYIRVLDEFRDSPDSDHVLYLLHYLTVYNVETNTENMKHFGHVRGIILDQNNEIVCRSFGYTPEIAVNSENSYLQYVNANSMMFPALEGTVIRLFNWNNHWILSTHRRIDGTTSHWNGPAFGEMWEELWKNDFEIEDNKSYIFILQHPGNKHIFPVATPALVHVATVESGVLDYNRDRIENSNVQDYVDSAYDARDVNNVGIMVLNPDSFMPIKLVSNGYIDLKRLRGNNPYLGTRYVHLMSDPDQQKALVENFPSEDYQQIDRLFDQLVTKVHKGYIVKFVKKSSKIYPKEQHVTMLRCHSWYMEDPQNRVVRSDTVREMLRTTPGNYLNTMINSVRNGV
jgi:hypothetical protein